MKKPAFLLFVLCFAIIGQSIAPKAFAAPVENFGQNLTTLKQAFANGHVHILQIGDSHTAGDYFTEQLRKRLQAELGDGGLGFAHATKVSGQRTARHDYQADNWKIINSRHQSGDYPLGGIIAMPNHTGAILTLTSQYYADDTQYAKIIVKGSKGQTFSVSDKAGVRQFTLTHTGWQAINTTVSFPANLLGDDTTLGGFWLRRNTGGIVSAMGINGATQDFWGRWRSRLSSDLAQSQAHLVILAYGTNEAFQSEPSNQAHAIQYAINQIRQGLPHANILLINASESLKSTTGECGTRPANLDMVRQRIQTLAKQNGTLYWDWQAAMGGVCSMKTWIKDGLAVKDGVHFTRAGYERAANDLYNNLKILLDEQNKIPINNTPSTLNYPKNPSTPSTCTINGQPCDNLRYSP